MIFQRCSKLNCAFFFIVHIVLSSSLKDIDCATHIYSDGGVTNKSEKIRSFRYKYPDDILTNLEMENSFNFDSQWIKDFARIFLTNSIPEEQYVLTIYNWIKKEIITMATTPNYLILRPRWNYYLLDIPQERITKVFIEAYWSPQSPNDHKTMVREQILSHCIYYCLGESFLSYSLKFPMTMKMLVYIFRITVDSLYSFYAPRNDSYMDKVMPVILPTDDERKSTYLNFNQLLRKDVTEINLKRWHNDISIVFEKLRLHKVFLAITRNMSQRGWNTKDKMIFEFVRTKLSQDDYKTREVYLQALDDICERYVDVEKEPSPDIVQILKDYLVRAVKLRERMYEEATQSSSDHYKSILFLVIIFLILFFSAYLLVKYKCLLRLGTNITIRYRRLVNI